MARVLLAGVLLLAACGDVSGPNCPEWAQHDPCVTQEAVDE